MKWKRALPVKVKRIEKNQQWHEWFAWRPVTLNDGCNMVWLEKVWRKGTKCFTLLGSCYLRWQYKGKVI